jgi:ribosome-associated protein
MDESKEFPEFEELPVSKSQRRRDALEVRSLAARLIELSPALRAQLPLDEDVCTAIEQARAIRSNVARKRQLQFVAKLLRRADPEAIREAMAAFDSEARKLASRQHRSEAWRDHLLVAGDAAVGVLLTQRPGSDDQRLRQLIRKARKEGSGDKPPAAARVLFRLLREMDEFEPLPPIPAAREPG